MFRLSGWMWRHKVQRTTRRVSMLALALMVCGPAASAHADLIRVLSGSFSWNSLAGSGGPLELVGTDGFSLSAFAQFGNAGPGCCLQPGEETIVFGGWSGNDLPGTATYRGETFTNLGGPVSANQLRVEFVSDPFTLPLVLTTGATTVDVPFTLTGTFRGAPGNGNFAQPTVMADLLGQGIGTVLLFPLPSLELWQTSTVTLTLSPPPPVAVPEPSTIVLMGIGLIVIGYWGRRGRSARSSINGSANESANESAQAPQIEDKVGGGRRLFQFKDADVQAIRPGLEKVR